MVYALMVRMGPLTDLRADADAYLMADVVPRTATGPAEMSAADQRAVLRAQLAEQHKRRR